MWTSSVILKNNLPSAASDLHLVIQITSGKCVVKFMNSDFAKPNSKLFTSKNW